MPSHDLLASLNDEQRAAVTAPLGPVLVLAGAGSGKTRVLTHRAAWLILENGVSPHGLMAVTFTNKAASEMRGRIESLLSMPADALWIGTFHGLSHRMLRRHWREARLPQSFQILDDDDQQRLVRRIIWRRVASPSSLRCFGRKPSSFCALMNQAISRGIQRFSSRPRPRTIFLTSRCWSSLSRI